MTSQAETIIVRLPKPGGLAQAAQLISVAAAAKLLGVSCKTIIRHSAAGRIVAVKVGARYKVDAVELAKVFGTNGTNGTNGTAARG